MLKIIGFFLLIIGIFIIWLFPAFTTPRKSLGAHLGRDQYYEVQLNEHKRRNSLNIYVCSGAGVLIGIGVALCAIGFLFDKKRQCQIDDKEV